MSKTQTKEIVNPTSGDNSLPDYLKELMGQGAIKTNDGFTAEDVALPQIKLLQGSSEQCKTFDNAKPGQFWHTGMDIPLGDNIKFVVCSRRRKYLLQAPLDDGQGVLARADDAHTWDRLGKWDVKVDKKTTVTWTIADLDVKASGLTEWGSFDPADKNSPPAATLFYEYLVLVVGHEELGPAVISLARSAIRKAKKGLNDKIEFHQQAGRPMQAIVFAAKNVTEQNDSNQDYYNWSFTGAGFADVNTFNTAKSLADMLPKNYRVQEEGVDDTAKVNKEAAKEKAF